MVAAAAAVAAAAEPNRLNFHENVQYFYIYYSK